MLNYQILRFAASLHTIYRDKMQIDDEDKSERRRRIELVKTQCGGIVPTFEAFYIQSILYASTAADDAFERFARAVIDEEDDFIIVSSIQEALTYAGGVFRFFHPPKNTKDYGLSAVRAEKLRKAFSINDPIVGALELRNSLEHFDERLDNFLLSDPTGYFFPGPIVDTHSLADEKPGQIFRLVDPWEFIVVLLGKKYDFLEIRLEIARIKNLAKKFDENGSRLPFLNS